MASGPFRIVGAMVIEIGGVLLALALLPGLPWQQWKTSLMGASNEAYQAAEIPPALPPSRYAFQLDGQPRRFDERVYTPPAAPSASMTPRRFAPPSNIDDRSAVVTEQGPRNLLPALPPEPQRREYVAETLDRASQQILDSLAAPWSDDPAALPRDQVASEPVTREPMSFRPPAVRVPPTEQQYLRPQLPNTVIPPSPLPAPNARFGQPSPPQPLNGNRNSATFAAPPLPLEQVPPRLDFDPAFSRESTGERFRGAAAPVPTNADRQPSQPRSFYAPQNDLREHQATSYEEPLSNEYYTPRNKVPPPSKFSGPTHVRPAGPRHIQY
jgi:hypothetical protein